jgi:hypothetical protein
MSISIGQIGETILKGAPNFIGLLVSVWLMYQVIVELLARNKVLTDLLLSCNVR